MTILLRLHIGDTLKRLLVPRAVHLSNGQTVLKRFPHAAASRVVALALQTEPEPVTAKGIAFAYHPRQLQMGGTGPKVGEGKVPLPPASQVAI